MYSCNPLFKKSKKIYPVNDIVENESYDKYINDVSNNKTNTNSSQNTSQNLKKQHTIYK
jgi:hypothetical protein